MYVALDLSGTRDLTAAARASIDTEGIVHAEVRAWTPKDTLAERALVMGYWGRRSTLFGAYEKSEDIRKRFSGRNKLAGKVYDAKAEEERFFVR